MRTSVTEYINGVTGEITRVELFEVKKREYEIYMKKYLENIVKDKIKCNATETDVLERLQLELKHSSSMIRMSSSLIKDFAITLEVNVKTIQRAINKLAEIEVLIYVGNDTFHLNPKYYWNGSEGDKAKELNMILEKLKEIQKDEDTNRSDDCIG